MSKWSQRGLLKELQVLGGQIEIHKQSVAHVFKTTVLSCNYKSLELHSGLQMKEKPYLCFPDCPVKHLQWLSHNFEKIL